MFGHKEADVVQALVRIETDGRGVEAVRGIPAIEDPGAIPAKTLQRRETYFAAASTFWWSR